MSVATSGPPTPMTGPIVPGPGQKKHLPNGDAGVQAEFFPGRRHDLPDPETLINDLRLHPALARRKGVTKGAKEVFAWIMALALVHGIDNPTTSWLAVATGDGERQVARSLAELEDLAVVRVLGDGHNRRLRVAEYMVPAKGGAFNHDRYDMEAARNPDRNDNVPNGNPDRNGSVPDGNLDRNGDVPDWNHDKNGRDSRGRVGISESTKESKSQDSESQSRSFNSLSEKEQQKAQDAWEMFGQKGSLPGYETLRVQCQGRDETWEIALLSAQKEQDERPLRSPLAWLRWVASENLALDKHTVEEKLGKMRRFYETPAQRQEIDARERQAAADKAAHMAPPAPQVAGMAAGAVKGMPGGPSGQPQSGVNGGAGSQTPPPPPDTAGTALVPIDADVSARLSSLSPLDRDQVRYLAQALAQAEDAQTMHLSHASAARKNLVRRHLRAALARWDQEQESRPKPMSPAELSAAIKSGKMVRPEAAPDNTKETA